MTDARQGLEKAPLDQVEHRLVVHLQHGGHFDGGIYFHDSTYALSVADSKETNLAQKRKTRPLAMAGTGEEDRFVN